MATLKLVQCQSCGGIYPRAQADGTEYYHACPPRKVVTAVVVDQATGKVLQPAVYAAIANPRNENIAGLDANKQPVIVAAGAGAIDVVDPAVVDAFSVTKEAL